MVVPKIEGRGHLLFFLQEVGGRTEVDGSCRGRGGEARRSVTGVSRRGPFGASGPVALRAGLTGRAAVRGRQCVRRDGSVNVTAMSRQGLAFGGGGAACGSGSRRPPRSRHRLAPCRRMFGAQLTDDVCSSRHDHPPVSGSHRSVARRAPRRLQEGRRLLALRPGPSLVGPASPTRQSAGPFDAKGH